MSLYALGLNHATAPVSVREMVAFQADKLGSALRDLIGSRKVKEAAILSTCNRTEVYFHATEPAPVMDWLEGFHGVPKTSLAPYLYTLPQDKAVPHAFRVASGLDSMVLGEPQILGQMKQAVKSAEAAGSLGLVLNRLFQRTFAVAKDVRTQTDIGSASITVANRTLERGAQLASRVQANAITLNELPERLAQFDIIVTSTASSLPILGKGLIEWAIKARRHAPMFIVDLAVPRDVEPEAAELDDVFLYTIDDLSNIIKDNLQIRVEAVREAEAMIADQAANFLRWLEGRTVVPTIAALQGHHDQLRVAELDRARRLLAGGAPPEQVVEQLARGLTNKFLHAPTQALNRAGEAERAELLALLHHIYQLPDEP